MTGYYLIIGISMLVSWLVSSKLKSKFAHYSQVHLRNGMSGKEVAEKMLRDNNINDVKVISVPGQLTDHLIQQTKQLIYQKAFTCKEMLLQLQLRLTNVDMLFNTQLVIPCCNCDQSWFRWLTSVLI